MQSVFIAVLNMSLTASFVIAAIMLARLPLKKTPKIISYALWATAGFRLAVPFSIESAFSLIPINAAPIPTDIAFQSAPHIESGITAIDVTISAMLPSASRLQTLIAAGTVLWLFGAALMLIRSFLSIFLLKKGLRGAILAGDGVYEAENIKTPFVIGFFRPKIYIPEGLSGDARRYIILHERTHIRRRDHIVKIFAHLLLCLHWFNPLAWAAFWLMGADMEMSCDESVISGLGENGDNIRNNYSVSLVRVAAGRKILNGSPLAFSEGGMKERINNVLNFKKRSGIFLAGAVALAVVIGIGLMVNKNIPLKQPEKATLEAIHVPFSVTGDENGMHYENVRTVYFEMSDPSQNFVVKMTEDGGGIEIIDTQEIVYYEITGTFQNRVLTKTNGGK